MNNHCSIHRIKGLAKRVDPIGDISGAPNPWKLWLLDARVAFIFRGLPYSPSSSFHRLSAWSRNQAAFLTREVKAPKVAHMHNASHSTYYTECSVESTLIGD